MYTIGPENRPTQACAAHSCRTQAISRRAKCVKTLLFKSSKESEIELDLARHNNNKPGTMVEMSDVARL